MYFFTKFKSSLIKITAYKKNLLFFYKPKPFNTYYGKSNARVY